MEYTKSLKLDMNPSGVPPVVRAKQGDGFARFIQITLTKDGVTYIPESGITYLFRCEKPDGTCIITDSVTTDTDLERKLITYDISTGVIMIELVDQVDAVPGRCRCDLCLQKSEKVLSTVPFVIEVIAAPNVANRAISTDDFRTLENALAEWEGDLEEVIEATDNANRAAGTANAAASSASSAATAASTATNNANKAAAKLTGMTGSATRLAPGATPTVTVSGGTESGGNITPYNVDIGVPTFPGLTASAESVASDQQASATVTGGTSGTTKYNIALKIPVGKTPIPTETYSYQNSTSGTTYPTGGTWTSTPNPEKGKYTWRKTVTTWAIDGVTYSTTTDYDVAYQGLDGTGAVLSVNNKTGNVVLGASDIQTNAGVTLEAALAGITFKLLGTV